MAVGDFSLASKIVVITGGGSGIGLAFAKLAASQGSKIIIADLRLTQEAEILVKESQDIVFTKCDVTIHADLEALITVSEKEFSDVPDVYIPSAGIFERPSASFWTKDASATTIYSMININLHPIPLTRIAFSALLHKNKKGVILVLSSVAGLIPSYPTPLYNATKHALLGFVKSMKPADEEENVKVCALCPGAVSTPLWADPALKEQFPIQEKAMPAERVADVLMRLVQEGKYRGGSIITLSSKDEIKVLPEHESWAALERMAGTAYAPVRETLKAERKIA